MTKWSQFCKQRFHFIFLYENVWILIKNSLKFVPKGPINNIRGLVQVMTWLRSGDKPVSEAMVVGYRRIYASLGLIEFRVLINCIQVLTVESACCWNILNIRSIYTGTVTDTYLLCWGQVNPVKSDIKSFDHNYLKLVDIISHIMGKINAGWIGHWAITSVNTVPSRRVSNKDVLGPYHHLQINCIASN